MTAIHILAGALALLAGYTAMFAAKGSWLHRRAGLLFVIAMAVMGISGAVIAALLPVRISIVAGLLVVYLVGSALLTVKRDLPAARLPLVAMTGLGMVVAVMGFWFGGLGLQQPTGALDGHPAPIYFVFGSFALLGSLLDLRLLHAGGIQGRHRLARHLWRMELAMVLAASAFFLGQARLIPDVMRHNPALLAAPVLLVLLHAVYWLTKSLRVRRQVAGWLERLKHPHPAQPPECGPTCFGRRRPSMPRQQTKHGPRPPATPLIPVPRTVGSFHANEPDRP